MQNLEKPVFEYDKILQLADRLEQFYQGTHIQKAAETLRAQAEFIKESLNNEE